MDATTYTHSDAQGIRGHIHIRHLHALQPPEPTTAWDLDAIGRKSGAMAKGCGNCERGCGWVEMVASWRHKMENMAHRGQLHKVQLTMRENLSQNTTRDN